MFVSLPTGYGKSLCYALLPLIFDKRREAVERRSIVMVVSPLIALRKDQSDQCELPTHEGCGPGDYSVN